MEKVAYQLKDVFSKVKAYFSSPKFLRFWDKFMKIMRTIIPQLAIYAVLIAFSSISLYFEQLIISPVFASIQKSAH